jgi:acetylglutamate/LysW-gamma-L-alpha-aminoadipate kinase
MLIIKIGGGETINIEGVIRDLTTLEDKFVILHGANALRDQLAAGLNIEKKTITSVSGYTSVLSDHRIIDLMMMAYAGLRNKRIVELCQIHGFKAGGTKAFVYAREASSKSSGISRESRKRSIESCWTYF